MGFGEKEKKGQESIKKKLFLGDKFTVVSMLCLTASFVATKKRHFTQIYYN